MVFVLICKQIYNMPLPINLSATNAVPAPLPTFAYQVLLRALAGDASDEKAIGA
jgi:hypothetical protein